MKDDMKTPLKELLKDIVANGVVDAAEVTGMRKRLYADGVIDQKKADFLFAVNNAVSGHENMPGWQKLFVEALTDYVLDDKTSSGEVDMKKTNYLISKITVDNQADANELALLVNIMAKAKATPPKLQKFVLTSLKEAILDDEVIDANEVKMIKTVLYGSGGSEGSSVSRAEADFLFYLNDAVSEEKNSPAWKKFFVEAITKCVLEDAVSPGVVDNAEAKYLMSKITIDGQVDDVEKALISNIRKEAKSVSAKLTLLGGNSAKIDEFNEKYPVGTLMKYSAPRYRGDKCQAAIMEPVEEGELGIVFCHVRLQNNDEIWINTDFLKPANKNDDDDTDEIIDAAIDVDGAEEGDDDEGAENEEEDDDFDEAEDDDYDSYSTASVIPKVAYEEIYNASNEKMKKVIDFLVAKEIITESSFMGIPVMIQHELFVYDGWNLYEYIEQEYYKHYGITKCEGDESVRGLCMNFGGEGGVIDMHKDSLYVQFSRTPVRSYWQDDGEGVSRIVVLPYDAFMELYNATDPITKKIVDFLTYKEYFKERTLMGIPVMVFQDLHVGDDGYGCEDCVTSEYHRYYGITNNIHGHNDCPEEEETCAISELWNEFSFYEHKDALSSDLIR